MLYFLGFVLQILMMIGVLFFFFFFLTFSDWGLVFVSVSFLGSDFGYSGLR